MAEVWKASNEDLELIAALNVKYHPELIEAKFGMALADVPPFKKDHFNWGKVQKFSSFNKLWHKEELDFSITLSAQAWEEFSTTEKNAWLDLHLTRCSPEYVPEFTMEGKKKKPVKDSWGRTCYTNEVKLNADGSTKWLISSLDLTVFAKNIRRFGFWCDHLSNFKTEISSVK